MSKHIMVALMNPADGRDAEFNDWYENRHLPDILGLDGIVSAHRYRVAGPQLEAQPPFTYLTVYELDDGGAEKARESIMAARAERARAVAEGRTPQVPLSDSLADDRQLWLYDAIAPE
jgi:hypothetical protein